MQKHVSVRRINPDVRIVENFYNLVFSLGDVN